MRRPFPSQIRILALIAVLVLAQGCKEREQLEKEAPALARADLGVDRIAIAGVVTDVTELGDSAESRESRSLLVGDHLGRDRFGKLPIVSYREVQAALGRDDHDRLLDRFKDDGECEAYILAELDTLLEGKARFIVFGNIESDRIEWSENETEVENEALKTTTKTKTMTTSRTTCVRLRFYDLNDQQLAWDHLTVGESSKSKARDLVDIFEHDPNEGFLGSLVKAIVNDALTPDPKYPPTPAFESSLANAFDNVGAYLKPSKKK